MVQLQFQSSSGPPLPLWKSKSRSMQKSPKIQGYSAATLTVAKKKWIIYSIYRPPDSNIETYFSDSFSSVNRAWDSYDNIIIMGDVNIDTHDRAHPGFEKLMSFCDVVDLTNIVKSKVASQTITAPPLMSFLPIDRDF